MNWIGSKNGVKMSKVSKEEPLISRMATEVPICEQVCMDRRLLCKGGFELKNEFLIVQVLRGELQYEKDFFDILANARTIESRLKNESKLSKELTSVSQLEEEFGQDTLNILMHLRVSRIVQRQRILRGYLDTFESQPLVSKAVTPNLYFTILRTSYGRSLMRENHGLGIHYHYSDDGIRRADILLTFSRQPIDPAKPVTWEPHAIKKAAFKARTNSWGSKKRQSVHDILMRDLKKRSVNDYLHPGNGHQFLIP